MEEIFSNFRASLLCEDAGQSQHFDIIFEKDLSPAFRIIFRIENRMIFVASRPKNCFDPFCKFLPSENWCTIGSCPIQLFEWTQAGWEQLRWVIKRLIMTCRRRDESSSLLLQVNEPFYDSPQLFPTSQSSFKELIWESPYSGCVWNWDNWSIGKHILAKIPKYYKYSYLTTFWLEDICKNETCFDVLHCLLINTGQLIPAKIED